MPEKGITEKNVKCIRRGAPIGNNIERADNIVNYGKPADLCKKVLILLMFFIH